MFQRRSGEQIVGDQVVGAHAQTQSGPVHGDICCCVAERQSAGHQPVPVGDAAAQGCRNKLL